MSRNSLQIIREVSAKNIAFAVDDTAGFAYNNIANDLASMGYPISLFAFEHNPMPRNRLAVQQMKHLWGWAGTVFCFDLGIATFLKNCPHQKKIYLFDNSLLWTKLRQYYYSTVADVYLNKRINILTTPDKAQFIENIWKKPTVIENFTSEEICNLLQITCQAKNN